MAELSTLARPYAKAAFDFANEHSAINEWEDFLFIASVVVSDASFKAMLDNPAIVAEQKAHALIDLYDNEVAVEQQTAFKQMLLANLQHRSTSGFAKVSQPIKNFVVQLAEQERLVLLPQVYQQYCLLRAQVLKQVDAYITSAYPLSDTQRILIKTRLEQSMNASIILHESVDPSLLAGATIKIGDKIVDDSMRGKLKQLKTQLTA